MPSIHGTWLEVRKRIAGQLAEALVGFSDALSVVLRRVLRDRFCSSDLECHVEGIREWYGGCRCGKQLLVNPYSFARHADLLKRETAVDGSSVYLQLSIEELRTEMGDCRNEALHFLCMTGFLAYEDSRLHEKLMFIVNERKSFQDETE